MDTYLELVGGARAGRGREEVGHVVAEGAVVGVLLFCFAVCVLKKNAIGTLL
jgi:hypothetical protein